jgi:quinol monooxygenase YgiN
MQTASFTPADLNDGFVVAITIEAKPGEEGRVATILDVMVPPTMAEPGVKLFLPYRSPTDPALFFVFELYVDAAGWDAHQATQHFKDAVRDLLPRVVRRERVPFQPFTPLSTSGQNSARSAG